MLRLLALLLALAPSALAADASDSLVKGGGTQRVAVSGGDTVATYTATCAIDATASTEVRAAVTNRGRRRICLLNASNAAQIAVGTSTVLASNLWRLGESTNTATSPIFCSNSSAAIYCGTLAPGTSATLRIIEETQSVP